MKGRDQGSTSKEVDASLNSPRKQSATPQLQRRAPTLAKEKRSVSFNDVLTEIKKKNSSQRAGVTGLQSLEEEKPAALIKASKENENPNAERAVLVQPDHEDGIVKHPSGRFSFAPIQIPPKKRLDTDSEPNTPREEVGSSSVSTDNTPRTPKTPRFITDILGSLTPRAWIDSENDEPLEPESRPFRWPNWKQITKEMLLHLYAATVLSSATVPLVINPCYELDEIDEKYKGLVAGGAVVIATAVLKAFYQLTFTSKPLSKLQEKGLKEFSGRMIKLLLQVPAGAGLGYFLSFAAVSLGDLAQETDNEHLQSLGDFLTSDAILPIIVFLISITQFFANKILNCCIKSSDNKEQTNEKRNMLQFILGKMAATFSVFPVALATQALLGIVKHDANSYALGEGSPAFNIPIRMVEILFLTRFSSLLFESIFDTNLRFNQRPELSDLPFNRRDMALSGDGQQMCYTMLAHLKPYITWIKEIAPELVYTPFAAALELTLWLTIESPQPTFKFTFMLTLANVLMMYMAWNIVDPQPVIRGGKYLASQADHCLLFTRSTTAEREPLSMEATSDSEASDGAHFTRVPF